MSLSRFNHQGGVHFDINTEGLTGVKASEVYAAVKDAPLLLKGIFINKDTGYGESVSVITPNAIIYFSKASLQLAREIREDPEAVAEINKRGAAFKITEFEATKFKKKGYAIRFLEDSEIPEWFTKYQDTGEIDKDVSADEAVFKY